MNIKPDASQSPYWRPLIALVIILSVSATVYALLQHADSLTQSSARINVTPFEHAPTSKTATNHPIPLNGPVAGPEFGPKATWYRLDVTLPKPDSDWVLLLDNPMIDALDVYQVDNGHVINSYFLGDLRAQPDLKHALPHVTFRASGQSAQFIVRSQTQGAPYIPFVVFSQTDFTLYAHLIFFLWGGFVCIVLVTAVYNLILFVGSRDKLYLIYTGYVLAVMITLGVVHGFAHFLFPDNAYHLLARHTISTYYLTAFFSLWFALLYLRYNTDTNPALYKLGKTFAFLLLGGAILTAPLAEYQSAQLFFGVQLLLYLFALYLMARKLKKEFQWARYYFISWLPLYIGAAIGPLMMSGYLEYSFWSRHALLLGVMFEITFMSMALADRLRHYQHEHLRLATHDPESQLPNQSFLAFSLQTDVAEKTQPLTLIMVELTNIQAIQPYITRQGFMELQERLKRHLESQLQGMGIALYPLRLGREHSLSVLLRHDVLAFIGMGHIDHHASILTQQADKLSLQQTIDDLNVNIKAVTGVAEFNAQGDKIEQSINAGYQAIEKAHEQRTQMAAYYAESAQFYERQIILASELSKALSNEQFCLYYQPQVELESLRIYGAEALIRWHHPSLGWIYPDQFIPIAEATGMITPLTRWVIRQSLTDLEDMASTTPSLSVNVSTQDVCNETFCDFLDGVMTARSVSVTSRLTLEVTETTNITEAEQFERNLQRIKSMGVNVAIDDFGTAYASLQYISSHGFDKLKLDKAFILNLATSQKNQMITKATVSMAKSLKIELVAEGIEDEQTVNLLVSMGCLIGQGYYFARPMPKNDYLVWVDSITAPAGTDA
ncbi:Histidine kinase [Saliniradius amylolyticus]|uniref:Histidine kinase n=1 Tax=Saliniradius amylolyticus TaxID=2183582 RepID=A0A2S2E1Q0_9ALTE|nr:EAL domain-containing protein [Saliniradius amylolyticus]AWL11564.1 Histidine kinase [Saliniradius amylolyticus]